MATNTGAITYNEGAAPSTPASAKVITYAKSDGLMYSKDDAGVETLMSGGAGGGGAVATDSIWDAAGDLAVGSGADTAAKLTKGSNGDVLTVTAGVVGWAAPSGGSNLASAKVALASGNVTTSSTSYVDATGVTVTLTTGARRCLVTFTGAVAQNGASTEEVFLRFAIDGTGQGGTNGQLAVQSVSGGHANASFSFVTDALSAGSHTIKLQWRSGSGQSVLLYANSSTWPATLAVVELYAS